jgi:hypothetical protein
MFESLNKQLLYYRFTHSAAYYPLANEVAKGYSTFRNILVNTLESTFFNGF